MLPFSTIIPTWLISPIGHFEQLVGQGGNTVSVYRPISHAMQEPVSVSRYVPPRQAIVGCSDGSEVVGSAEGMGVGCIDGSDVGTDVGSAEGMGVGCIDGSDVGTDVGDADGVRVGMGDVGTRVGRGDTDVGTGVGRGVGDAS
jgi:hypothetical protein